ncbi:MAG: hypothetical protein QM784_34080 [Polyangiaceae bacterium]
MITQGRDSWVYDDFEHYLLESAQNDQAPADLPERLGTALGLSVPVILAAELGSTLLPLSSPAPLVLAASKSTGMWATGTLWMTAVKGIAIGLLAGTTAISAGHVAVAMTTPRPPSHVPKNLDAHVGTRTAERPRNPTEHRAGSLSGTSTVALHPTSEDRGMALPLPAEHREVRSLSRAPSTKVPQEVHQGREESPLPTHESQAETGALAGKPSPVGVASFEVVTDERTATTADKQEPKSDAVLAPEEYRRLRAKTIARVRTLLGRSEGAEAIAMLDQFRSRVGAARFGVEELLLRVEALVNLGRSNEALKTADLIARLAPNSAELRRARLIAGSRQVR